MEMSFSLQRVAAVSLLRKASSQGNSKCTRYAYNQSLDNLQARVSFSPLRPSAVCFHNKAPGRLSGADPRSQGCPWC